MQLGRLPAGLLSDSIGPAGSIFIVTAWKRRIHTFEP
jgi:hypothetical protein